MFFREKGRSPRLRDSTSEPKASGESPCARPVLQKRFSLAVALGLVKERPNTTKRSITDLPTELLAPILNDVLDDTYTYISDGIIYTYKGYRALTELSLTCRRFREILKLRRFARCNIRLDNTTDSGYYVYGYRLENVPEKYQAYRHSGACVRKLHVASTATAACTWDLVQDLRPWYRSLSGLFGMLLPNFTNLISVTFCRATSLPLNDFFEGISLVLTTCLSVQRLELELFDALPCSDEITFIDNTDLSKPRAQLQDLSLYLHHRDLNQPNTELQLWFVEALSKVLMPSTPTLKNICFHYVDDRIKKHDEPNYIKKSNISWPLPSLETIKIDPSHTTLWAFDSYFEVNPSKVRHITLSRLFDTLPSDETVLNFLHKFTSLKIAEIGSPPKMEWIEFFMDAKCHFING
ncbi:hypothetical protein H072_9994 [Dactylellina haptotyla CBS 200.50]|uniref:F-box domain-containing protein n=1 Tax=Dactylellina haptotyla (strain CBS 200.50) TaxID=1284197 RepID=S8BMM7_DACHA|nr:hypothetical protein H072_9994 [Dactylellina haptotyla CBS 200.50]